MCHEATNQMKELLAGSKPTLSNKGLIVLAMTQDKNFLSLEKKIDLNNQSSNEKLDLIIKTMTEHHADANRKFEKRDADLQKAIEDRKRECAEHKLEINKKFSLVEATTEDLNYFKKNPKIFIILAIGIIALISFAIGSNFSVFNVFKAV